MSVKFRRLNGLEDRVGYIFNDKALALQALTHSSYGDGRREVQDNERLEFLGDRVLGLLTAEKLFQLNLDGEGAMAQRLNALVRKETCARVARKLGVGDALEISASEEKQGGRDKISILGDACEALLAAIYLDGGATAAKDFYDTHWAEEIALVTASSMKDPKTALQEKAASRGGAQPVYTVVERSGPDHRPLFVVEVAVDKIGKAKGSGKSKKDAERYAAQHLLEDWPS